MKLLDYKPEPWTIDKTMDLLMYMTDMLCGGDDDLEYTNALRKFGKDRFDLLFPDFFDVNDPVIPKETDWSFIDEKRTEMPESQIILDSISEIMEKPNPANGSNNWAVSGEKSSTGNPILAGDPHLGINLPSIWFVMQLSSPNQNTYGVTLPGALGVIIGFNTNISWTVTNATRDVKDWYKIEFKDATKREYKYNDAWKKTSFRVEEIKIKGKETYLDSVVYTHHGPVSYDASFKGNNEKLGYAMKWAGHMGHNFTRLFFKLNSGKNYDDYQNAISNHVAPAQNFAFASVDGDIALWVQGKFPNKWKGQGKFLMDGSKPENDWQSFIPKEYNAHTKNPERGFISSANQHPVDESYPFYVFNDGYETYRNRVINNFLTSKDKLSIQDFKDLQNNNYNLKASELLPFMFNNLDASTLSKEEKEILSIIKKWDFNSDFNQLAPSIWDAWWKKLYTITWDEDPFMDIISTPEKETSKDLFLISFKEAVKTLNAFKTENGEYYWSKYKGAYAGHLLQALPAFSRFNIPIGGDRNTVNAADKNHGPSWRMIVEMSSPPKAYGIYPGGQSGNPGSKFYDNFIDDWAAGQYFSALFMQNQNETKGIIATQTLKSK
mgnify:FL=1